MQNKIALKLIWAAHYNEIASLMQRIPNQPIDVKIPTIHSLYLASDAPLLFFIAGEGVENAIAKTSSLIAVFSAHPEYYISSILNIGTVGGLHQNFKKNQVLLIDTIYGENQFKSFSSTKPDSMAHLFAVDCISAQKRALNESSKKLLSINADVVDRELWGVALSASVWQIPWYSLKIISDELDEKNFCQMVIDLSLQLSEAIYAELKTELPEVAIPDDFYFTTSQKRKFIKLRGNEFLTPELKKEIVEKISGKKERAQHLIDLIERAYNPHKFKIIDSIHEKLQPLKKSGISYQFDNELESIKLGIRAEVHSQIELDSVVSELKQLSLNDVFSELLITP